MILVAQNQAGQAVEPWLFYPFAALAVAGALGVVLSQQIVRMAVYLLFTLGAVAFLYFLLSAEFLAAIQLIVYVGGTLILIIFGVMLTSKNPFIRLEVPWHERLTGWGIGLAAAFLMIWLGGLVITSTSNPSAAANASSPFAASPALHENAIAEYGIRDLGVSLLTQYVVPFELAGVLLLVVMIGAAYIAKGRHAVPDDHPLGGGRTP